MVLRLVVISVLLIYIKRSKAGDCVQSRLCLVPLRRFPSPYRSIHFGDVSEANGPETPRQKQNANACVAF